MKNLIVGMGEIGKAVTETVGSAQTLDIEKKVIELPVEVMHICFPYTEHFKAEVRQYMLKYKPEHVIVYSTVPIGTCESIGKHVVHSFCEGKHPNLELSIQIMERWLGTSDKKEAQFFTSFFEDLFMRVKVVGSSKYTEALKLLSTTEYGVNIEFARYKKQVIDDLGMDFELTKEFNREYNRLYRELGLGNRFQKFILDAPEGPKGGHCVTSNAKLLYSQYPSELVRIVAEL